MEKTTKQLNKDEERRNYLRLGMLIYSALFI